MLKQENMKNKVLFDFKRFIFVLQNFKLQSGIKQGTNICDISIKINKLCGKQCNSKCSRMDPSSHLPSLFRTKISKWQSSKELLLEATSRLEIHILQLYYSVALCSYLALIIQLSICSFFSLCFLGFSDGISKKVDSLLLKDRIYMLLYWWTI